MFGITAFAQSPFAALGGTVYSRDLTESVAAADAVLGALATQNAVTETAAATDAVSTTQALRYLLQRLAQLLMPMLTY